MEHPSRRGTGHDDTNDEPGSQVHNGPLAPVLGAFLLLVVVGGIVDLYMDQPQSLASWHVVFEIALVLLSLTFAVMLFVGWRNSERALSQARSRLSETRQAVAQREAERDAWRARAEGALRGFSQAIDQQFVAWQLTPAEREIALLLLQGEGHKQIAARLTRSERTVRQHAVEVYRKAGLQGRAELAAFFLQDLTLPGPNGAHS